MSGLPGPSPQKPNPTPYVVLSVVASLLLGVAMLGVIGVVTWRSLSDDPSLTPEPAPTPTTLSAPAEPSPTTGVGDPRLRRNDQANYAAWVSPTGNISCVIDHAEAWCWAEQHTWSIPAQDCDADWGDSVVLWEGGANYGCRGDPTCISAIPGQPDPCGLGEVRDGLWWARPSDPVAFSQGQLGNKALPYGNSIQIRDLRCDSRKTGMHCTHLLTGRGFMISRDKLVLR